MGPGVVRPRLNDPAGMAVASVFVGVLVLLAVVDGGFNTDVFLPVALFAWGLLVTLALARPSLFGGVPRPTAVALVAFAAFVAWSFASIGWADVKGEAWTGANRALLYLALFTAAAVWPWTPAAAAVALGGFALATAGVGVASVELARRADEPLDAFVGALFVEPIGYHNATAALFALAFWPALLLASRRELHPLARGATSAAAGANLSLAVVGQSRGSLLVFPMALALYVAIVPGRARSILTLLPVGATTLLALDPLLDLYSAADESDAATGLERVRDAVALQAVALFVIGTLAGLLDRRVAPPERVRRRGAQVVVATAIAAAAVVGTAVLPADPVARAEAAWEEFKAGDQPDDGSSHFTSHLGSNRYDFWRVGLDVFREHPVHGIGVDNFAVEYLLDRRSDEEPLYPHSLEVQMLSQVGVVGTLLLAAFFVAALLPAFARRDQLGGALGAVVVVLVGYWAAHASGDWLWEMPAVTAPALAFLGLANGLMRPPPLTAARWALPAVGAVGLLAAVSLTPPWLAEREMQTAAATWGADPDAAYARLDRARTLDPLTDRADHLLGSIASRRRDWTTMRAAFERALERNPRSWYAYFELAVVEAVTGRRSEALRRLAAAERLNPSEPLIEELRRAIRRGREIDPDAIDREFLERLETRTG